MTTKKSTAKTNYILFYERIRELGYSLKEVAILAGIKPKTFYSKLQYQKSFTDKEIAGLKYALALTDEATCQIFLCGYTLNSQAV